MTRFGSATGCSCCPRARRAFFARSPSARPRAARREAEITAIKAEIAAAARCRSQRKRAS